MTRLTRSSASILTSALAGFTLTAGAVDRSAAAAPMPGLGAALLERGLGHAVTSTRQATTAAPAPSAAASQRAPRSRATSGAPLASAAPASPPTTPVRVPQDTTGDEDGLPLEPARRLTYTATEGSWMSLDVSPDGESIVFDLLGDLYTVPIQGGRATRLTSGLAFDGQPRFSPDGMRIVFTSDRDGGENLWILSLDLSDTVQVTEGKNYRFQSPEWIIMAARELGLMPTTEGSLNFKLNLTEALDGYSGQEHNIPVYPLYEDIVRLFTETGIAYTPTLIVTYGGPWVENWFYEREDIHADPKLRRFMPHSEVDDRGLRRGQWFHESAYKFQEHAEFVADLVEAGGRAGIGSHGQLQGLGYHWELWAIQSGGLSEHDALRVATTIGADAIGLASEVGTIEPGKLADLVVLARDPLEDIRNTNSLVYVMKNGRLYEADTLNEVWPRQRELPRQWWAETEPDGVAVEGVRSVRSVHAFQLCSQTVQCGTGARSGPRPIRVTAPAHAVAPQNI